MKAVPLVRRHLPLAIALLVLAACSNNVTEQQDALPELETLAAGTVEVRVGADNDDVEEAEDGTMHRNSPDLDMIYDGSVPSRGDQKIGVRFTGIDVPTGATITKAYLEFTVDETSSDTTKVSVRGIKEADPATFPTGDGSLSGRSFTEERIIWEPGPWTSVGAKERTDNFSNVVQELVNLSDWESGNAMAFVIRGERGERVADSYDGEPANAPLLHVEYETADVPAEPLDSHPTRLADSLAAGINVSTHWNYETHYRSKLDVLEPLLAQSGIRIMRQAGIDDASEQLFKDFYTRYGIQTGLVVDDRTRPAPGDVGAWIDRIGEEKIAFVAMHNEPDFFPPDGVSIDECREGNEIVPYIRNATETVAGQLPTGMPFLGASWASSQQLRCYEETGDQSQYLTHTNSHFYSSWRHPETGGWGGVRGEFVYGSLIGYHHALLQGAQGDLPRASDEGGYSNCGKDYVPEQYRKHYLTRSLLYQHANDHDFMAIYELMDQSSSCTKATQGWGLIKRDGVPKASYYHVKNLIALTEEPGASCSVSDARYTLTNDEGVYTHTLKKCDGETIVIMWQPKKIWQPSPISEPTYADITVNLDIPDGSDAEVYTLSGESGPDLLASYENADAVDVAVNVAPIIVKF